MTQKRGTKPMIIGLTGGIGMGKSTAAEILQHMGFPIYSADRAVHGLLKKNGKAVKAVARLFPQSLKRGGIDRKILGQSVFGQPEKLRALEKILHPLVAKEERAFIRAAQEQHARAVILEIPLLFETGGQARCDAVLCVSASLATQKKRVLARPGMTAEKYRAITARQMPEAEKRRRADYIVPTGGGLATTAGHLQRIMKELKLLNERRRPRAGGGDRLAIRSQRNML